VVIGKGPYENNLRRLAEKFSLSDRINWHIDITREELLKHYVQADVFIMLSTREAYGITAAEALASGTPCIVAKGSALDEFIDGRNCIGIEMPITTEKLVKAVQLLKDINGEKIYVSHILDWDDVTYKLIEVYEEAR
jgi:glycosyltransferase involved in cell wall biosynthesis